MNIGEEEEAVEMPMPLAPGQQPVHEPTPVVEPVKEPAHARTDAELDQALVDAVQSVARQLRSLQHG